jgi:hypothetical protein
VSIPARYSGFCPECGERWQPGDLIRCEERTGSPGADPAWKHAVCPDPLLDRLIGKPCPVCWLVHPEGVCDR